MTELERRLQRRGSDDEDTIQKRLEIAQRELEQSKTEGFHDKIFVNDDLETTYKQLENYIFGVEESSEDPSQFASNVVESTPVEPMNTKVDMVDTEVPAPQDFSKLEVVGADDDEATAIDSTAEFVITDGETS